MKIFQQRTLFELYGTLCNIHASYTNVCIKLLGLANSLFHRENEGQTYSANRKETNRCQGSNFCIKPNIFLAQYFRANT